MKRRYSMVVWIEFDQLENGPVEDGRPLREEMEAVEEVVKSAIVAHVPRSTRAAVRVGVDRAESIAVEPKVKP